MGLDMFLYIRKNEYCSKYYKDEGIDFKLELPKDVSRFFPNLTDLTISRTTDYKVGYWRKANAIHSWFLENCAAKDPFDNPIDDCRPIEIPLEKLEELSDEYSTFTMKDEEVKGKVQFIMIMEDEKKK